MPSRIFSRVLLLVALPIFFQPLKAQSTNSQINGQVTDESGAAVPGSKIIAVNVGTGVTYDATSDQSGLYNIPLMPPGDYRIDVNTSHFRSISRSGVKLDVNQTVKLDFKLQVGSNTETISVTEAAPVIDTESGSVSNVIDNRKVTQLPLNGRNIYSLNALVPGAAPDNTGRIRFNGARARSNEVLVDGVTQVPPETRSDPVSPPPVDSVDEFKIASSSYSAEFGSAAGGLINVATKAGTNEFHGTLWEFFRNDKLNTRNFFAPPTQPKPVLRQNQFGAAGGGPVLVPHVYNGRNRSFFFADFEKTYTRSQTVYNVTVPTAAMRGGNLSQYLGRVIGTDALGNSVAQGQIYDPSSTRTSGGATVRTPFAGKPDSDQQSWTRSPRSCSDTIRTQRTTTFRRTSKQRPLPVQRFTATTSGATRTSRATIACLDAGRITTARPSRLSLSPAPPVRFSRT